MGQPQAGQGFDVNPDQIDEHAKQVERTHEHLRTALDADKDRVDVLAFGLIGNLCGMSLICNNLSENVREALQSAISSGEHHVAAVRKWAEVRRVTDQDAVDLLKRAEQVERG
ncbi:hypothetical protein [Amycolatopsis japonica]|uniref:Uncharacterized protein n=1 Tax=Amycolatopsis japonica TaxID=208439 RepID=A0A075V9I6_9PSEU|nr:hypothetical protein [Amycolatopsis japonica]AIG81194.1 Hypothetical protein AJAP_42105 [Amycolatopsis japonica]